ncbi:hypothetical protein KXJ76_15905 [Raoultella ornithinolytica]|uniref:hypothetical protein n=1 Tax=Raoultella ornithinolytica TaxID=54291 RepID=UPI001C582567|nr:hypothetical protein [Raoultella ornithinolytica]QXW32449.1 hypothetical protein KXJ76_15905 [Raoultella ornithinolytica]
MLRRLCFWALFAVVLLVAWRLAGMLMDMVLLAVSGRALRHGRKHGTHRRQ